MSAKVIELPIGKILELHHCEADAEEGEGALVFDLDTVQERVHQHLRRLKVYGFDPSELACLALHESARGIDDTSAHSIYPIISHLESMDLQGQEISGWFLEVDLVSEEIRLLLLDGPDDYEMVGYIAEQQAAHAKEFEASDGDITLLHDDCDKDTHLP